MVWVYILLLGGPVCVLLDAYVLFDTEEYCFFHIRKWGKLSKIVRELRTIGSEDDGGDGRYYIVIFKANNVSTKSGGVFPKKFTLVCRNIIWWLKYLLFSQVAS